MSFFRVATKYTFIATSVGTGYYWYDRLTNGSANNSAAMLREYYYPGDLNSKGGVFGSQYRRLKSTFTGNSSDEDQQEGATVPGGSPSYYQAPTQPTHGQFDVVIIGGGILGMATARELRKRYPDKTVAVLEKEPTVAVHQSSHNSGVIHAGIYDKEDSLKTTLCIRGNRLMYEYCKKNKLPVKNVGKLVVAVDDAEVEVLQTLWQQIQKNQPDGPPKMLTSLKEIQSYEPNVEGKAAIWSPSTGIVDFAEVTRHMLRELSKDDKFTFIPKFQVDAIGSFYHCMEVKQGKGKGTTATGQTDDNNTSSKDPRPGAVAILGREPGQAGPAKVVEGRKLITCAGLHMDTIGRMAGGEHSPTIVPFRGRYYELSEKAKSIVKANIYPVPRQTGIPVGVHFTPTVSVERGDQMIIGPGAAFSPHKEGYRLDKFSLSDFANCFFCKANWNFLATYWISAADAIHQDISREAFIKDAQRMVPSLKDEDVIESYAGVMAQTFAENGKPNPTFMFEATHCPDVETPPLGNLSIMRQQRKARAEGKLGVKLPDLPSPSKLISSTTGAKEVASSGVVSNINNAFHVRNAPSPAATSAFALAEEIVDRAAREISL